MGFQIDPPKDFNMNVKRGNYAIGIVLLGLAVIDVIQGYPGEPSLKWGWLESIATKMLGNWGYTILQGLGGLLFLCAGFFSKDK